MIYLVDRPKQLVTSLWIVSLIELHELETNSSSSNNIITQIEKKIEHKLGSFNCKMRLPQNPSTVFHILLKCCHFFVTILNLCYNIDNFNLRVLLEIVQRFWGNISPVS